MLPGDVCLGIDLGVLLAGLVDELHQRFGESGIRLLQKIRQGQLLPLEGEEERFFRGFRLAGFPDTGGGGKAGSGQGEAGISSAGTSSVAEDLLGKLKSAGTSSVAEDLQGELKSAVLWDVSSI